MMKFCIFPFVLSLIMNAFCLKAQNQHRYNTEVSINDSMAAHWKGLGVKYFREGKLDSALLVTHRARKIWKQI